MVGQITPMAPASAARMISAGSFQPTRTSGTVFVVEMAVSMATMAA
jgi:hypothetical protein